MFRIERDVGAARLDDGVHADQQIERTPNAETDQAVRADAPNDQLPSEAICPRIELCVGQDVAFEFERYGVWGLRNLLVEKADERPRNLGPGCTRTGGPEYRHSIRNQSVHDTAESFGLRLDHPGHHSRQDHRNQGIRAEDTAHGRVEGRQFLMQHLVGDLGADV
ncbi:hypothetical protein MLGJGCBP_03108 [Rhodococcus sp. T7]|nr:hypothetical protein MLGJGCBP_03108 [Rhodococcus sp. T7]